LASRIREDGIDILVDLAGHTADNRLFVFARKPAPIQVSWLGFGYTTGLSAIDWFLGDERFTPPGCDALFREKVWRLPRPVFVYRPTEEGMPDPDFAPHRKNHGAITFGCFSRSVRYNDRVLDAWAEILKRVPGSFLMLNHRPFADSLTAAEFRARFARRGIDPFRLKFGFVTPPWPAYREIDIALDAGGHHGVERTKRCRDQLLADARIVCIDSLERGIEMQVCRMHEPHRTAHTLSLHGVRMTLPYSNGVP